MVRTLATWGPRVRNEEQKREKFFGFSVYFYIKVCKVSFLLVSFERG